MSSYLERAVADQRDREDWLRKRDRGIGASDAAKYAKRESAHLYLRAKLEAPFAGNQFTAHGNQRERFILSQFRIVQNTVMFHAEGNPRHLATPDGIRQLASGEVVLAQVKTSAKPLPKIPPAYQRQMWWEQYVMGVSRTLFIWEEHAAFLPTEMEPKSVWFVRDDEQVARLIEIADVVIAGMDEADAFRREMEGASA